MSATVFDTLKIGGGGYICNVHISNDGLTRVCRCDTYGAYKYNSSSVYKNGATTAASGAADLSTTLTSATTLALFARNSSGTPANFANYQASAFACGGGLTSTQAFALNNRINTFMTGLSVNVY